MGAGRSSVSRQPGLDALRGLAITLVVAFHFLAEWPGAMSNAALRSAHYLAFAGWTGVDLFFVLSGFLIGGILIDHRSSDRYFTTFYTRRVLRIVPLYLASLGIYGLLYRFFDWRSAGLTGMFQLQLPVWSLLSFSQNILLGIDGVWRGPGWLGISWSLCVEEQFYLLLPALVWLISPRRVPLLCLAAIAIAPVFRILVLYLMPDNALAPYVLLPARMDALFMGVLAAWLWRDEGWRARLFSWRRPLLAIFLVMTVALLLNLYRIGIGYKTQTAGYTVIAFYYLLALLLAVSARPARPWLAVLRAPLCWAGLGAYSIYLFHRPIQGLVVYFMGSDSGAAQLVSLLVIAAVAWVCWRFVEKPAIAYGHRTFLYRTRTPRPAVERPLAQPESA